MDLHCPVERLTRKQTTSRPDTLWPEIWKDVSDASKRKEKSKWAIEKPKLDNARRLRGIYFIHPDDEDSKDTMKNARGKLEIPMPAAMLCKLQLDKYRETCRTVEEHKKKFACMVEADESMRKRMEGSPHKNHEDHIAGKGMNSSSNCNLVHKFIPMPQAMKVSTQMQRQQWRNNGKTRENTGMAADTKVRNKNEVIAEVRNGSRKVHVASLMDLCHLKNSELEPQLPLFQKYKDRVVLRGDTLLTQT